MGENLSSGYMVTLYAVLMFFVTVTVFYIYHAIRATIRSGVDVVRRTTTFVDHTRNGVVLPRAAKKVA